MQSHIMSNGKDPDPEIAALAARITQLEKDWMGRKKQITPPFRRFNHGFVDSPDLCGLCPAIFKIFRIPVNQWTLATAALGGVFIVAGLDFINEL